MREMPLSMRVPSVALCGAVPWVPSSVAQRGNGIGETHEEGGKLHLIIFRYARSFGYAQDDKRIADKT